MGKNADRILKILSPLGIGISHYFNRRNITENEREIRKLHGRITLLYLINLVVLLWLIIGSLTTFKI